MLAYQIIIGAHIALVADANNAFAAIVTNGTINCGRHKLAELMIHRMFPLRMTLGHACMAQIIVGAVGALAEVSRARKMSKSVNANE